MAKVVVVKKRTRVKPEIELAKGEEERLERIDKKRKEIEEETHRFYRRGLWTIALLMYLVIMFWFAAIPGQDVPGPIADNAKYLHFLEFFGLTILIGALFSYYDGRKFLLTCGVIFVTTVAALTELIQLWIPGRSCSITDFFVDLAGAFAPLVIVLVFMEIAMTFYMWSEEGSL
jgi:VanZ family protein